MLISVAAGILLWWLCCRILQNVCSYLSWI